MKNALLSPRNWKHWKGILTWAVIFQSQVLHRCPIRSSESIEDLQEKQDLLHLQNQTSKPKTLANAHFCLSKSSVLSRLSLLQTDTLFSSTWELLPSFQSIFGFCLKNWAPFTPQFNCSKVYYTGFRLSVQLRSLFNFTTAFKKIKVQGQLFWVLSPYEGQSSCHEFSFIKPQKMITTANPSKNCCM